MTVAVIESLRKICNAQVKFSVSLAGTLGQEVANEMAVGYQELLKALDDEPIEEKPGGIFGERMFKGKPRKKKE